MVCLCDHVIYSLSIGEDYCPKLGVIVVQKRISTRLFQKGTSTGLGNPPPGTVVDHTCTRKGWYVRIVGVAYC